MPRKRQATIIRLIRVAKRNIEGSGLSLGDALNVALFALTVVSLVIAGAGVLVAWITYQDAKSGGEKQVAALNDAATSLRSAKSALDDSKKSLGDIDANIKGSVALAHQQQDALFKSAELAGQQLDALKAQSAILDRKPVVTMSGRCHALHWGNFVLAPPDFSFRLQPNEKFSDSPDQFTEKVQDSTLLACEIELENRGNAPLTEAFANVTIGIAGSNIPLNYFPLRFKVAGEDSGPLDSMVHDYEPMKELKNHGAIVFMQDGKLFPSSTNGVRRFYFVLIGPPQVDTLFASWRYGGKEMAESGRDAVIALNRLGPESPQKKE